MLLQAMEWKHVWIGMEQVKARARRLKNLTPAKKYHLAFLNWTSFWLFYFLCLSIGKSQLIRLQCLNDDPWDQGSGLASLGPCLGDALGVVGIKKCLNDDRKVERRRKSLDHSISHSVLEKNRRPARFTGFEHGLLGQNTVALPLAPPPLPARSGLKRSVFVPDLLFMA